MVQPFLIESFLSEYGKVLLKLAAGVLPKELSPEDITVLKNRLGDDWKSALGFGTKK
jgi:hypothetical protein